MSIEKFRKLSPEEREAVDNFAFALSLLNKGGDAERRFTLICMDSSIEIALRAYLLKRGYKEEEVKGEKKFSMLLDKCKSTDLVDEEESKALYQMHDVRNKIYHGNTVMVPSKVDLEVWSKVVGSLIKKITSMDPFEYYQSKGYERISVSIEDLSYVEKLERKFRKTPPYVKRLTWWSEIQRDVIERGEKWDLYVHYRPRWPFFIPTLILVKCNPAEKPMSAQYMIELESKAIGLKSDKKVWRVWLGLISSQGFEREGISWAENYERRDLGLILINPRDNHFYYSREGQCKKALKWLWVIPDGSRNRG